MINTKAVKILWIVLTIVLCFGSFILKNQVHDLELELSKINQSIQKDVKSIHVLKAEWSHLNNPQRLRHLAQEHISLNKIRSEQIINYSALPFEYEDESVTPAVATNKKEYKRLVKAVQ